MIRTNWNVITGTTSSGKSTVLNYLAFLNYNIIPESARILIDIEISNGKSIEEIRGDEYEFQFKVLQMKVNLEKNLDPKQLTFFDRGIPDSMAFFNVYGYDLDEIYYLMGNKEYKNVFLLDSLPFKKDYARVEDIKTVKRLDSLLYDAYDGLGYDVIRVPVMSVDKRAEFILDKIK